MKWIKTDELTDIKSVVLRNNGNISEEEFIVDENKYFRIDKLDEVASLIKECINKRMPIRIIGDYDVDGVSSTSIMYMTLKSMGANVTYRLPKRISEGFGLSEKMVDEVNRGLIITVDNGIAAIDPIKKAKEKGLTVIVIDHHLKDERGLPDADLIIDPNAIEGSADFSGYCGGGLAYRVAQKLIPENKDLLNKLLCFAALATVADVMELRSENRRIVETGLKMMTGFKTRTTGLASILTACDMNKHITATDIAFKIGPMLNAPGRLYDDGAKKSVEALTYNGKYTEKIGQELIEINEKRKIVVAEAVSKIETNIAMNCLYGDNPLVVYEPGLNEGVIGIIAGRLAESMNVPTIVFTDTEDPSLLKGSGRTAKGIHLKALLDKCSSAIYKYGGHAEAAGITIEKDKLNDFIELAQSNIDYDSIDDDIKDYVNYDLEIEASDLSKIYREVEKYEPYGNGNPKVVFKIKNYKLSPRYSSYYKLMGADQSHIRLYGIGSCAIWFGEAKKYLDMGEPTQIDIIGVLSKNYYMDKAELQVEVIDIKDATVKVEKSALGKRLEELAKNRYEKGEPM